MVLILFLRQTFIQTELLQQTIKASYHENAKTQLDYFSSVRFMLGSGVFFASDYLICSNVLQSGRSASVV